MAKLANDSTKDVVLFINDYNPEFDGALDKLSKKLQRQLFGIILLDKNVLKSKTHKQNTNPSIKVVVCDFSNPADLIRALNPYSDRLLAVNASSERNQPYYKKLIPHIPYINTPTESSLDWSTLKSKMRNLISLHNPELSTRFQIIQKKDMNNLENILSDFTFPVICKPVGLAASILVNKAINLEELKEIIKSSFESIDEVYKKARGRGAPELIVEEFIEGDMYSIDAYVNDIGKVWTLPPIRVTTAAAVGKRGYYSYRIDSDHLLKTGQIDELNLAARKAIHSVGLRSSAAHIELFLNKSGWKIIEIGPRAGGYRQDMYMEAYGINHAYNELLVKVGLEPELIKRKQYYSAIFNIYAETEGKITSINGINTAMKVPSLIWMTQHSHIGDMALDCGKGGNFIFDGVLANKNKEILDADMNTIRNEITIITDPGSIK